MTTTLTPTPRSPTWPTATQPSPSRRTPSTTPSRSSRSGAIPPPTGLPSSFVFRKGGITLRSLSSLFVRLSGRPLVLLNGARFGPSQILSITPCPGLLAGGFVICRKGSTMIMRYIVAIRRSPSTSPVKFPSWSAYHDGVKGNWVSQSGSMLMRRNRHYSYTPKRKR